MLRKAQPVVLMCCSKCKLFSQDEVDRWEARMANPGQFGGGAQMFAGGFGLAMLQNK